CSPAGPALRSGRSAIGSSAPPRDPATSVCAACSRQSSRRFGSTLPSTLPYSDTVNGTNPTTRSAAIQRAGGPSLARVPFDQAAPVPSAIATTTPPASTPQHLRLSRIAPPSVFSRVAHDPRQLLICNLV